MTPGDDDRPFNSFGSSMTEEGFNRSEGFRSARDELNTLRSGEQHLLSSSSSAKHSPPRLYDRVMENKDVQDTTARVARDSSRESSDASSTAAGDAAVLAKALAELLREIVVASASRDVVHRRAWERVCDACSRAVETRRGNFRGLTESQQLEQVVALLNRPADTATVWLHDHLPHLFRADKAAAQLQAEALLPHIRAVIAAVIVRAGAGHKEIDEMGARYRAGTACKEPDEADYYPGRTQNTCPQYLADEARHGGGRMEGAQLRSHVCTRSHAHTPPAGVDRSSRSGTACTKIRRGTKNRSPGVLLCCCKCGVVHGYSIMR